MDLSRSSGATSPLWESRDGRGSHDHALTKPDWRVSRIRLTRRLHRVAVDHAHFGHPRTALPVDNQSRVFRRHGQIAELLWRQQSPQHNRSDREVDALPAPATNGRQSVQGPVRGESAAHASHARLPTSVRHPFPCQGGWPNSHQASKGGSSPLTGAIMWLSKLVRQFDIAAAMCDQTEGANFGQPHSEELVNELVSEPVRPPSARRT